MQTELNKSKKIMFETRQQHKANKTGFTNFSLPVKSSILNHILDSKHEIEIKP